MNGVTGTSYNPYSNYEEIESVTKKSLINNVLHEINEDSADAVAKLKEIRKEIEAENAL